MVLLDKTQLSELNMELTDLVTSRCVCWEFDGGVATLHKEKCGAHALLVNEVSVRRVIFARLCRAKLLAEEFHTATVSV